MSGEMVRTSAGSSVFPTANELLPGARHSQEGEIVPQRMRRVTFLGFSDKQVRDAVATCRPTSRCTASALIAAHRVRSETAGQRMRLGVVRATPLTGDHIRTQRCAPRLASFPHAAHMGADAQLDVLSPHGR